MWRYYIRDSLIYLEFGLFIRENKSFEYISFDCWKFVFAFYLLTIFKTMDDLIDLTNPCFNPCNLHEVVIKITWAKTND